MGTVGPRIKPWWVLWLYEKIFGLPDVTFFLGTNNGPNKESKPITICLGFLNKDKVSIGRLIWGAEFSIDMAREFAAKLNEIIDDVEKSRKSD